MDGAEVLRPFERVPAAFGQQISGGCGGVRGAVRPLARASTQSVFFINHNI